jgi:hypothetical protein
MRGILHAEDFSWSNAPRFGGGGGGGTTQTNTVQKSDPWQGQQDYLTQGFEANRALYDNPADYPQYFPGVNGVTAPGAPTYVPFNWQQEGALSNLYNYGMGGTGAQQGAQNFVQGALSPGYTGTTGNSFNGATNTTNAIENGQYQWVGDQGIQAANPQIATIGGGGYLGYTNPVWGTSNDTLSRELSSNFTNPFTNPGWSSAVNTTLASVLPGVESSFIGGNRSDSGLATRAATQAATDAVGNLASNEYNTLQGIQNQAIGQAQNNQNMALNATLAGANLASNNYNTGVGNMLNAANLASNNFLTQQGNQFKALALAPTIDSQTLNDLTQAFQAGGQNQGNQQNIVNSAINQWNYAQSLPFNMLSYFQNGINGNYGGTTASQLTQPYYTNPGANALSGALGGAALGSGLASTLGITGGEGALGGAGIGALLAFL